MYTWVKADIDRYVRKVGVRSIEGTRYQARLDAKVEELAQVYCSNEFILEVYRTLAGDHEFVAWLQSEWEIELTERVVYLYRMLVMYREPLTRADSGYHLPSTEEVADAIKTYFTQAVLTTSTVNSLDDAEIMIIQHPDLGRNDVSGMLRGPESNRSHYINFFIFYLQWYKHDEEHKVTKGGNCNVLIERGFSIPPPAVCLLPSVFTTTKSQQVAGTAQQPEPFEIATLRRFWTELRSFVERCKSEHAAECPFVYFFVKYCLDHGIVGVPRAALAVYDRMNMQLSREFIRCANPTCQHNKLDKSTGKIKFRQCGRCLSVIYCSRECQTAHYPEHKKSCEQYQEDGLSPDNH